MEHPVGAGVPGALQQFVAQLFRLLRLAVGTDHGAQARFADVGMREADEHRRRQHALRLQRDAALLQRFVGFGVRALAHHVRQHGLVAPAHDGLDLALERAHDDVGRAQPGGVDVHVRIGMEAADDGGVPDDVVVEVGVHVQRYRHRRRRIDLAQAAQQVALGVFHALGHHGAVQVQQDGVEAAALDLVQHQPAQAFVCLGAGRPAGPGFGGDRQHDLGAAARHLDVAAQAAVGVLIGPDGAFAGQNFGIAAKEAFQRRGHGRVCVRLVLDHCQ